MFSAFKRLVGSNHADGRLVSEEEFGSSSGGAHGRQQPAVPAGVRTMDQRLQRKFARGVQYNMKLVLKGDRNVGKTCLFLRLQGHAFREEYEATDEIQVCSIQWNYKATDDVVKVEVWDVVDKGRKRKPIPGLKLREQKAADHGRDQQDGDDGEDGVALDAEFIDVYKGANGVIMLFDCTKGWTFDYVRRELPNVPSHVPVLVLANHRDMGHHRVVTADQVRGLIEELGRHEGSGQVRYAEASMRNGFGLKFLHTFFNLPFLHLQRETFLKLLETNCNEIGTTCQELDLLLQSEEQDYDRFLHLITNKRRQAADMLSAQQQQAATRQQNGTAAAAAAPVRSVSMPAGLSKSLSAGTPVASVEPMVKPTPSIIIGAQHSLPVGNNSSSSLTISGSSKKSPVAKVEPQRNQSPPPRRASLQSQAIDSNCKSETLDSLPEEEQASLRSFLSEPMHALDSGLVPDSIYEEESEDEAVGLSGGGGNPMVSAFQEDLDGDLPDEAATVLVPPAAAASHATLHSNSVSDSIHSMSLHSDTASEARVVMMGQSCTSSFVLAPAPCPSELGSETGSSAASSSKARTVKSPHSRKKEPDLVSGSTAGTTGSDSNKSKQQKKKKKAGRKKRTGEQEEAKRLEDFLGPDTVPAVHADQYELF